MSYVQAEEAAAVSMMRSCKTKTRRKWMHLDNALPDYFSWPRIRGSIPKTVVVIVFGTLQAVGLAATFGMTCRYQNAPGLRKAKSKVGNQVRV